MFVCSSCGCSSGGRRIVVVVKPSCLFEKFMVGYDYNLQRIRLCF